MSDGHVGDFTISFTVQAENFREMGDAVDLAKQVGSSHLYFGRMTNWGTFSPEEYAQKAVFLPSHPDYAEFVATCRDARLQDPIVCPSDLDVFRHGRA